MVRKAVGLGLGTALLAGVGCSHAMEATRNDNPVDTGGAAAAASLKDAGTDESDAANSQSGTSLTDAVANMPSADRGALQAAEAADENPTVAAAADQQPAPDAPADTTQNDTQRNVVQERDGIIASSDGSTLGTVKTTDLGELKLQLEGKKSKHDNTNAMTMSSDIPVFDGPSRETTSVLTPGTDVRVYYKNPQVGSEKEVIGVDIVHKADAPENQSEHE